VPVIWGVVAATAISGALWAMMESESIYNSPENNGLNGGIRNSRNAESEELGTIGYVLAAAGAGAIVGMIVTWPDDAGQAALLPTLTDTSAGFVWRTAF
jgi:hypothetical protein